MWRNWQTRMIQVHVRNHAGSSPVIRTKARKMLSNIAGMSHFAEKAAHFCGRLFLFLLQFSRNECQNMCQIWRSFSGRSRR